MYRPSKHQARLLLALLPAAGLLILSLSSSISMAGRGSFDSDAAKFNLNVSVMWDATPAELSEIIDGFQDASELLYDATDGQHQLGLVLISNNGTGTDDADVVIYNDADDICGVGYICGQTDTGDFGVSGRYSTLRWSPGFSIWPSFVIHELAHGIYCLRDEYEGPDDGRTASAVCDVPSCGEGEQDALCTGTDDADHACLMEKQNISQTEFCSHTNHDKNSVDHFITEQECNYQQSCWDQMVAAGYGLTGPSSLPDVTPPSDPDAIGWVLLETVPRIVLVLDRSGSMEGDRLVDAQEAGELVVDLVDTGNMVGVVSFAPDASIDEPIRTVSSESDRTDLKDAIGDLIADGATNYSAGLDEAYSEFDRVGLDASGKSIIFLSDGRNNRPEGTADDALATSIDLLSDEYIVVNTVGIGEEIDVADEDRLRGMADDTGGNYFRSPIGAGAKPVAPPGIELNESQPWATSGATALPSVHNTDLKSHFARLWAGAVDRETIKEKEARLLPLSSTVTDTIEVDPAATRLTIVAHWAHEGNYDTFEFCLERPDGFVICPSNVGSAPGVVYRDRASSRYALYKVYETGIMPGDWKLTISTALSPGNEILLRYQAFVRSPDIWTYASVDKQGIYGFPEDVILEVIPSHETPLTHPAFVPSSTGELPPVSPGFPDFELRGRLVDPDGIQRHLFNMRDDGLLISGDSRPEDGVWAARIPSSILTNLERAGTYTLDIDILQRGGAIPGYNEDEFMVPTSIPRENILVAQFVRNVKQTFIYDPDLDVTDVPETGHLGPDLLRLNPSLPNPSRGVTTISFDLSRAADVRVQLFNVRGARVAVLMDGPTPAGRHVLNWNGTDDQGRLVPSGIYYYRITADEVTRGGRMVRIR